MIGPIGHSSEHLQQTARRFRTEDRLAAGDPSQHRGDLVVVGVLQQVAAGSGAHRGEDEFVFLEHAQYDDTRARAH